MSMIYPHCDQNILHAPKECAYCDERPDWQELRMTWGINFTGHDDQGKLPCPSLRHRSLEIIERWHGNRKVPND